MKESLRTIFQSPFDIKQWNNLLQNLFKATELRLVPENFENNPTEEGYYLGNIQTSDSYRIGLFHYNIKQGSVANKRVGLRKLVKTFINPQWGEFDATLVVFNEIQSQSPNPVPEKYWRLSFICDIKDEATAPKRYTYVFGNKELLYKTPIDRFIFLKDKGISFENLKKAFSVEALSDEFFDKYREQYANFIQYITGKRFVKSGSKWEEKNVATPNHKFMQAFGNDEKKIRDYIKKMMGRITFLHFLQRKGWMCGDLNYMQNLFQHSSHQDDYLDAVLEPLFFGILNTKPEQREALFEKYSWDKSLLAEWSDIPYLNGGLFERDENDEPESKFPAEYFERLFNFFSEYNFTIDENDPNDAEVGVDPEMLGKIFENLLEDNKDKGAFYTPKEIVRYMCQESLIAYLETNTSIAKEKIRNFVLSPEEGIADISEKWRCSLIKALENVKICDPAIGSGAFPMGLLNELLHCRQALMYTDNKTTSSPNPVPVPTSQIKKSIIQNNIYGVDIEKGAVDIARLRFWLSIVVDEEEASPLPNLDYKIMQGNSLIESYKGLDLSKLTYAKKSGGHISQYSIFEDDTKQLQREVTQLLTQYYSCSDHDKKTDLRNKISNTIAKQLSVQNFDADILRELRTLDLAGNDQFFLWHTWFSDVFSKGGFDIVIGNPPYNEISDKEEKSFYQKYFKDVLSKHYDLYIFFFKIGIDLLREKGIMTYITPHTFTWYPQFIALREYIYNKTTILEITDRIKSIFDSAVVDNSIISLQKGIFEKKSNFSFLEYIDNKLKTINNLYLNREEFNSQRFDYTGLINIGKLNRLNNGCVPLGEITKSSQGITVYAKVQGEKINYFRDTVVSSYSRPCLRGKNINRYSYSCNQYIEYGKWLWCPREPIYFENEKIFIRQTSDSLIGTYVKEPMCATDSIHSIISKDTRYSLKYILGILNSSLGNYMYKLMSCETGKVFAQVKLAVLRELPIKIVSESQQIPIIKLVDKILEIKKESPDKDTSIEETMINNLIYDIYGLSKDEIKIIEESV
ncbi:MAG: N-6 DNA methylase [Bacteroidales bacterium]|nr:N-6 DNA methylase [Bacteroidales bacterium]